MATATKSAKRAKAHKATKAKPPTPEELLTAMRKESLYATVGQFAKLLGLHRATVYRMVNDGKIPCVCVADAIRIRWETVEEAIKERRLSA